MEITSWERHKRERSPSLVTSFNVVKFTRKQLSIKNCKRKMRTTDPWGCYILSHHLVTEQLDSQPRFQGLLSYRPLVRARPWERGCLIVVCNCFDSMKWEFLCLSGESELETVQVLLWTEIVNSPYFHVFRKLILSFWRVLKFPMSSLVVRPNLNHSCLFFCLFEGTFFTRKLWLLTCTS